MIIEKNIKDLKPYVKNAKIHNQEQISRVASSIKEFGMVQPLVIDSKNEIIIGHCRFEACKKLKMETIPCILADNLSEDKIKALRLADNKLNESEWDFNILEIELDDIEFDMSEFGFDFSDYEEETEIIEDEAPEVDEENEPIAKLGDIWQLGKHRLMCGDSTDPEQVARLMNGVKAELTLSDPPYGVDIVKLNSVGGGGETKFKGANNYYVKTTDYSKIIGDETTETAEKACKLFFEHSDNQIIFGGNYFTDFLPPKSCWCIWDKQNTGNFADVEMAWTSFDRGAKLYSWLWNGLSRKGDRKTELVSRVHPTQKPVGMLAEILQDFSKPNDTIIDLFLGSGSVLIACEQTNRICVGSELSENYCDVIIKRYENLTGDTAVLIENITN